MCTLTLLTIAGTAISAGGALAQGQQAQQAADMQAKAYQQQAQADAQASAYEQQRERHKQDLLQAAARAQVGASGVGLKGSPTEVLAANAREGQLDIAAIRYGSQLRQNGLQTQGQIAQYSGKQAKTASYIAGADALASGMKSIKFGSNPFK